MSRIHPWLFAGGTTDMEFDASQYNILNLADSFIEQMIKIRNTLRIMSISALILAPFAIGLAIYLINHPSFFNVLQTQGEFGVILSVLLGSVIGISSVWMIAGIKQYLLIDSWNKKYQMFVSRKNEIDNEIASEFISDNDFQE
ncbi:MAG: hypothetical protein WA393_13525 [Nitrososphaeraceae archaeon]